MVKTDINKIFKVAGNKHEVICPPDQVFVRTDFDFLLTIGGGLVTNENEYNKLIELLRIVGETEFYIQENIGATITERNIPFHTVINLNGDYKSFEEKVSDFEPPFGWIINHYFIYGQKESWGIYISEFPTINIIGCHKTLTESFKNVFSINGNGYDDLKDFIRQEFQARPNLISELIKQYKLETY